MADEKLTTEELYGKSNPPQQPLTYEETPIIDPVTPSPPPRNSRYFLQTIGTIIVFVVLFGVGVWLSTVIRPYTTASTSIPENVPTPTQVLVPTPTVSSGVYPGWTTYTVVSGATKQPIAGISFRLPQDVLAPICDGGSCASQGTYLPGGTRFTIAPRGGGQALRDFRGAVVVDAGGREFTTTPTTVASRQALEFSGLFTGTTSGGYSFTQMRGVMIEVDSTLSLEINHFTPTGISADFASDDALFDEILKTLMLASGQQ